MKNWRKGLLSTFFNAAKCAGIGTILSASAACAITPWSGGPGLGEDRIDEPLLRVEPGAYQDITVTPHKTQYDKGFLNKLDDFLHPGMNDFTVQNLHYTAQDGMENTAELVIPQGEGPFPLVISFPILEGTEFVSELVARRFADRGYAVLTIQGRTLQLDKIKTAEELMHKYRYTLVDARGLLQRVKEMPVIDENRIGTAALSNGGLFAAALAGIEPDIKAASIIIAGGGLPEILHDSQHSDIHDHFVPTMKETYDLKTREEYIEFIEQYSKYFDASTYAGSVEPCRVLMISGEFDSIMPKERTEELWERFGQPTWVKYLSGHYIIPYFYDALDRSIDHFDDVLFNDSCNKPPPAKPKGIEPFVLKPRIS